MRKKICKLCAQFLQIMRDLGLCDPIFSITYYISDLPRQKNAKLFQIFKSSDFYNSASFMQKSYM